MVSEFKTDLESWFSKKNLPVLAMLWVVASWGFSYEQGVFKGTLIGLAITAALPLGSALITAWPSKSKSILRQQTQKAQSLFHNFVWWTSSRIVDVEVSVQQVWIGKFDLDGEKQTLINFGGVIYKAAGDS